MSETQKRKLPYSIAEMEGLLGRAFPEDDMTGPVLGVDDDTVVASNVASLLTSPSTVIGTAERNGQFVAISVAIPKGELDPNNPDLETAYVYYTAVEPSLQGGGLVADASRSLESQLKEL